MGRYLKLLRKNVVLVKFCVTLLGQRLLCGSGACQGADVVGSLCTSCGDLDSTRR